MPKYYSAKSRRLLDPVEYFEARNNNVKYVFSAEVFNYCSSIK